MEETPSRASWTTAKAAADAAFRENRFDAAVAQYDDALRAADESSSACDCRHILFSNRAAARLALGDFTAALRDAESCIAAAPQWAKGFGRKGGALYGLRDFSRAALAYKAGLALRSSDDLLKQGLSEARQAGTKASRAVLDDFSALDAATAASGSAPRAAAGGRKSAAGGGGADDELSAFFTEVSAVTSEGGVAAEAAVDGDEGAAPVDPLARVTDESIFDGVASETVIGMLLCSNYKWRNLNPFAVMQLPIGATLEDAKQRYKRLSQLVHPDKCADPRAMDAFIEVKKAYAMLVDDQVRDNRRALILGARKIAAKAHAKLVKENGGGDAGRAAAGPLEALQTTEVMKVFAQAEQRRRRAKSLAVSYTKRDREGEVKTAKVAKQKRAHQEAWDDSRDVRVGSWRDFQKKGAKKSKKRKAGT